METKKIEEEFIGKKILSIIDIDLTDEQMKSSLKRIAENDYSTIDSAHLILFEENKALVFVDFDCDGYRSGDWNIILIKDVLDKEFTKGIKNINSILKEVTYCKNAEKKYGTEDVLLLTTNEYVIRMGQDNSDSYYPSNFFDVEECKQFALGKGELLK